MLREDYLLRLIRQGAQAIFGILGLQKEQRYEQALEAVDHTLQDFLGLSSGLAARLPERTLVSMLTVGDVPDTGRLLFLAEMLAMEGDLYAAQGDALQSRRRYLKSLNLFLYVASLTDLAAPPDQFARIEALVDALRSSCLTAKTLTELFRYFEAAGRYAKAEDALFDLIEAGPAPAEAIELGIAFYERLRGQTDAELVAGNLPRAEVEQGLRDLAGMRRRRGRS